MKHTPRLEPTRSYARTVLLAVAVAVHDVDAGGDDGERWLDGGIRIFRTGSGRRSGGRGFSDGVGGSARVRACNGRGRLRGFGNSGGRSDGCVCRRGSVGLDDASTAAESHLGAGPDLDSATALLGLLRRPLLGGLPALLLFSARALCVYQPRLLPRSHPAQSLERILCLSIALPLQQLLTRQTIQLIIALRAVMVALRAVKVALRVVMVALTVVRRVFEARFLEVRFCAPLPPLDIRSTEGATRRIFDERLDARRAKGVPAAERDAAAVRIALVVADWTFKRCVGLARGSVARVGGRQRLQLTQYRARVGVALLETGENVMRELPKLLGMIAARE